MEASDRLLKYVGKLLSENGIRMVAECPEYCEQAHSLTRMNGLSMAFFRILELQLPLVEDIVFVLRRIQSAIECNQPMLLQDCHCPLHHKSE